MAPMDQNRLTADIQLLRNQGLSDSMILAELVKRGYSQDQVQTSLTQYETPQEYGSSYPQSYPPQAPPSYAPPAQTEDLTGRIEEIAESIIDEKWDLLIIEVKKIIEWKTKMEETVSILHHDVDKLKDDFKILHQGVLGKLEDYDNRMRDVGTELKAVGKVFKDVIPTFVENVKELSSVTQGMRKK